MNAPPRTSPELWGAARPLRLPPLSASEAAKPAVRLPDLAAARAALEPPASWRHRPMQLRRLLRARGLTIKAAAEAIGASPRGFQQWLAPDGERATAMPYAAWAALNLLTAKPD